MAGEPTEYGGGNPYDLLFWPPKLQEGGVLERSQAITLRDLLVGPVIAALVLRAGIDPDYRNEDGTKIVAGSGKPAYDAAAIVDSYLTIRQRFPKIGG